MFLNKVILRIVTNAIAAQSIKINAGIVVNLANLFETNELYTQRVVVFKDVLYESQQIAKKIMEEVLGTMFNICCITSL